MIRRFAFSAIAAGFLVGGCSLTPSSDEVQRNQQETILKEATAQTGMPAITSFYERKQLKRILEIRDRSNFLTYTYVRVPGTGQLKFICRSIGYGIPYATQYTNPQKAQYDRGEIVVIPQADPNGLFSPESADATWVLCVNPNGGEPLPHYEENPVSVSVVPMKE